MSVPDVHAPFADVKMKSIIGAYAKLGQRHVVFNTQLMFRAWKTPILRAAKPNQRSI